MSQETRHADAPRTAIIADDHPLVRSALRSVIDTIPDLDVVGEADNGVDALGLARSVGPHLLVLDSGMPLASGMEVFTEVRRWRPETVVAVVTGFTSSGHLSEWVAAGVDGLFLKTDAPEELERGFTTILSGGVFRSEAVKLRLDDVDQKGELTARERQILHLVADGYSNKEMAEKLGLSPKTIDRHRTNLMEKLEVHSVAQLLAYALKEGLLDRHHQS